MNVVLYIRLPILVSKEIKKQEIEIENRLKFHSDWKIKKVFIEIESGLNTDDNIVLLEAISYCKAYCIPVLVVRDSSRISRINNCFKKIISVCDANDIRIWSCVDNRFL